jgi:hypothetical protein
MARDPVPPLPKSSSNASGCLIGCLIVLVIGVAGVALTVFATYRVGKGAIDAMTEDAPQVLPEVTMTDEESVAASEKLDEFTEAIKSGQSDTKTFSFTGQEINVMLRANEDVRALGESVFVTIEDSEVRGEVSFNLGEFIPISFLEGRYANGSATFSVSASDGRLFVFVEDFQMKGNDAPPEILDQLRQENLAKDMVDDPDFRELMNNVESVTVEGDQLVVTLK